MTLIDLLKSNEIIWDLMNRAFFENDLTFFTNGNIYNIEDVDIGSYNFKKIEFRKTFKEEFYDMNLFRNC